MSDDGTQEFIEPEATVTVVADTGHGLLTNIHTFARVNGEWFYNTPPSHRQRTEFSRGLHPSRRLKSGPPPLPGPRGNGGRKPGESARLDERRVPLGADVRPRGDTLKIALEALGGVGYRRVHRDDLKVVLSQLGKRMVAVQSLTGDERRHAEAALFVEIITRCTRV